MLPLLSRFLQLLSRIILGLGLTVGLLYLAAATGPEAVGLAQAVLGALGMGVGAWLGWLLHPRTRPRPAVPYALESGEPRAANAALLWVQGFAAGFWVLLALTLVDTLLFDAMIRITGVSTVLLSLSPLLILFYLLCACGMVPLGIARALISDGPEPPRWTLSSVSAVACLGGLGLFVVASILASFLQSLDPGLMGILVGLVVLAAVVVIAVGTPVLAQRHRPSLRGAAWTALLALAALAGAWLLFSRLERWIGSLGPVATYLWLLLACLLWGGSGGGLMAVLSAQRRAVRSWQADVRESTPHLTSPPCEHSGPGD
jgi:hypothetical protein